MISISKNIIHKFISERGCKAQLKKKMYCFTDKQIQSVFSSYLKYKTKKENFFFTKNTVERILKMDVSKIDPITLSFIGDKCDKEFSFCFLEKEDISFCYTVDVNTVKILVFNGNDKTTRITPTTSIGKTALNFSGFEKAIVGSAIINFPLNELIISPQNALCHVKDKDIPPDYLNSLKKAAKDLDYLTALQEDYRVKSDVIFIAVKSFVFLKTASVIDKTFVSENVAVKLKVKDKYGRREENKEVTVINSFYDESINVISPFSVSGHFRKQPYKKGIEVIYIDSFMKKGYSRKAGILNT